MPRFIPPCLPTMKREPPRGKGWLHEVKFDGWRLQLHKDPHDVWVYSKGGHDFRGRFPEIEAAFLFFPARSAIVDAELTACDENGLPDFAALLRNDADYLCVWAFDLLAINGKDLRPLPLDERKARLHRRRSINSISGPYFGPKRARR
jgi:bifunctional non-homologous end joining protein LigD